MIFTVVLFVLEMSSSEGQRSSNRQHDGWMEASGFDLQEQNENLTSETQTTLQLCRLLIRPRSAGLGLRLHTIIKRLLPRSQSAPHEEQSVSVKLSVCATSRSLLQLRCQWDIEWCTVPECKDVQRLYISMSFTLYILYTLYIVCVFKKSIFLLKLMIVP